MAESLLMGRNFVSGICIIIICIIIIRDRSDSVVQFFAEPIRRFGPEFPKQLVGAIYRFFCRFFLRFNLEMPDTKLRPTSKDSAM